MASTLIFATACGGGGDRTEAGLGAGDYQVAAKEDVINSIVVDGTVAPIRSAGISSVTGAPVQMLHVQLGDRVKKGQLLVTMDTSGVPAGAPQLQGQGGPLEMTAASHIDRVFFDISSKVHDVLRSVPGAAAGANIPAPVQGQPVPPAPQVPQGPAVQGPSPEEIEQVIGEAHAQGRAQGQAEAQQMMEEQLMSQPEQMGVEDYPVADPEIYSPLDGVVTSIEVEEGAAAAGTLMTVSDTSKLLVRADVRESDIAEVREGNRVTFTTPVTGDREFEGRVRKIAPMADSGKQDPAAAARAMQSGGKGDSKDSGIAFPVEIEVVGDAKDLRLGSSARVEIISEEERGGLSIPRDAVYDDSKVLVLARENEDSTTGTIEERRVETTVKNDTDVAVTGGDLKAGDIVITWPEDYRDRIGEELTINDDKFNGGKDDKDGKDSKGGDKPEDGDAPKNEDAPQDDAPADAPADAPKE